MGEEIGKLFSLSWIDHTIKKKLGKSVSSVSLLYWFVVMMMLLLLLCIVKWLIGEYKEIESAQSSLPSGYFYFFSYRVKERKFNFRYRNEINNKSVSRKISSLVDFTY